MDNQINNRSNNNDKSFDQHGVQNGSVEVTKSCKCHGANGLHHFNCLPEHLQFNKYIYTGYRVDLSTWECFKSLFYLHNESFNVYSHGLAAITLVLLSPYVYRKISLLQFDPIIYPIHHITATMCVLFSTIYHLMLCHEGSKKAYIRFITLDYLGIWLVTGLSCITFLKATFFCFPQVHLAVTGIYFVVGFVCFTYVNKATTSKTRMQPLIALGAVRMFVLYPIRCLMTYFGYKTGPLGTIWYLFGIEMTGLFGGLINLSRLPEKWFRGKFDYFFNSHNIMHLLVLIAPAMLHGGTVMDFEWMQNAECPV